MAIARHGEGVASALRALGSQIHPIFMLPPVASSWFGSMLADRFSLAIGALHMSAIFFAVYTAHIKDGYVDFYGRGEDDDHPLSEAGCRAALVGSSGAFLACLLGLWAWVGVGAALLTLPTWLIAYHHAPQLDTNPVTTTTGYPLGISLSILGGYYVQTESVSVVPLSFSLVFLVLLSGIKVVDDAKDYDYDRSISKRTVAVVLGRDRARRTAFGLMLLALALVAALTAGGVFPPSSLGAVLAFGLVAVLAFRADPSVSTMLLIRGSYVFLALLLAAVWFRPLS